MEEEIWYRIRLGGMVIVRSQKCCYTVVLCRFSLSAVASKFRANLCLAVNHHNQVIHIRIQSWLQTSIIIQSFADHLHEVAGYAGCSSVVVVLGGSQRDIVAV